MRLSDLEKLIADLRSREGDLEVAATIGSKFTGIPEAETEPLDPKMIYIEDSREYSPFPGRRFVQIG